MSKAGLLDKFRATPNAVLFATSSFWQGVDVRGDQLSAVIIDKLPFSVPSDPVVAARTRYIDEQGGKSFFELQRSKRNNLVKAGYRATDQEFNRQRGDCALGFQVEDEELRPGVSKQSAKRSDYNGDSGC